MSKKKESCRYPLDPLVDVMESLLGEGGCPWDREQDHLSLRRYLLEECYEVIEAIEENNMHKLCEELGDLLLQIVFHACLAQAQRDFSLKDVVAGVTAKMIRRHPHVFGDVVVQDSEEVLVNWQQIKERERGAGQGESILAGIPRQLPALLRAQKLQARAAQVGFDWADVTGAWEKVEEELQEVKEAGREGNPGAMEEEIGDLLFAIVNVARFLAVEPETALTRTNNKFIKRFHYIEAQARRAERNLKEMTLAEMDNLWNKAKNNGKLCEKHQ
ncbi:MAG: nucleoside triphosphate pyrophosphohydrolase [bacterium]|jgi:tetrapyrrole methylase family protein/MazG family protein